MSDEQHRGPSSNHQVTQRLNDLEQEARSRREERIGEISKLWVAMREVQQKVAIVETERRHAEDRAARIEKRLEDFGDTLKTTLEEIKENTVTKDRYMNVERIVYGLVALILGAFFLALSPWKGG